MRVFGIISYRFVAWMAFFPRMGCLFFVTQITRIARIFFLNQNEKNGKEYSLMSHGENIFLSHTESTESTEFPLRGAFCHTDFFLNQNEKNEKEYSFYVTRMARILLSQSDFKILEKNFLFSQSVVSLPSLMRQ